VASHLHAYANAPTKTKKSLIILKILNEIRCNHDANFVKLDPSTGQYLPIEESAARITIAQALRDELNQGYKSSKQHKQRRRLFQKRSTAFNAFAETQAGLVMPNTTIINSLEMSTNLVLQHCQLLSGPSVITEDSSPFRLSFFLKDAMQIADETHCAFQEEEDLVMKDVFSSLFKAFGNPGAPQCSGTANPFEPTPIAEGRLPVADNDDDCFGSLLLDDFEPFPLVI
jgi:hypothetical protein